MHEWSQCSQMDANDHEATLLLSPPPRRTRGALCGINRMAARAASDCFFQKTVGRSQQRSAW